MTKVEELQKQQAELDAQIALLEAQAARAREDEIAKGMSEIQAVMYRYHLSPGNIFKAKRNTLGSATTGHRDNR